MAEIGGVDTSMYTPQARPDPFQRLGTAVGTLNALEQNRLIRTQVDLQQLSLATQQIGTIRGFVSTRLGQKGPITKDQIAKDGQKLVAMGLADAKQVAVMLSDLPDVVTGPDGEVDDTPLRNFLQEQNFALLDAQQKLDATMQQLEIDQGPYITRGRVNRLTGDFTPDTQFEKGLTPGELNAPTEVIGPDGSRVVVPRSKVLESGGANLRPPGITDVSENKPLLPQETATGEVAGDVESDDASGPMRTSFAPGEKERLDAMAEDDMALRAAAKNVKSLKATLSNMDKSLKNFDAGALAEPWNEFKSAWNDIMPDWAEFDPTVIRDQEEFRKQAINVATTMFAAIGGTGTDAKLAASMASNPNEALSNMSNEQIIALLKGQLDTIDVKNREWLKYLKGEGAFGDGQKHTVGDFADFEAEFNAVYDPRVFQLRYLDRAERKEYIDAMDDEDRMELRDAKDFAEEHGWVKLGG